MISAELIFSGTCLFQKQYCLMSFFEDVLTVTRAGQLFDWRSPQGSSLASVVFTVSYVRRQVKRMRAIYVRFQNNCLLIND